MRMRRRYVYLILFAVPGLILSGILTVLFFGMAAGALWLFAFGDNPWPRLVEELLSTGAGIVFVVLWVALMAAGYLIGKRREQEARLNRRHLLLAGTITVVLAAFVVLTQLANGNIGPRSEGVRCSDFCSARGYLASSVSPANSTNRTCSCLNASGSAVIQKPLDSVK
jgi:hypothetical protein